MSEPGDVDAEIGNNFANVDLYRNPNYVSLYRYENPTIPYDEQREGIVSKQGLIGSWFTDNLADLKTYTLARIKGERGGRFVVVRVKKEDLEKYDVTKLPEISDMDIERGNYIIPQEVGADSRVEVEGIFKDSWEGKKNVPFTDWKEVEDYISQCLTDEAIISRLEK